MALNLQSKVVVNWRPFIIRSLDPRHLHKGFLTPRLATDPNWLGTAASNRLQIPNHRSSRKWSFLSCKVRTGSLRMIRLLCFIQSGGGRLISFLRAWCPTCGWKTWSGVQALCKNSEQQKEEIRTMLYCTCASCLSKMPGSSHGNFFAHVSLTRMSSQATTSSKGKWGMQSFPGTSILKEISLINSRPSG